MIITLQYQADNCHRSLIKSHQVTKYYSHFLLASTHAYATAREYKSQQR